MIFVKICVECIEDLSIFACLLKSELNRVLFEMSGCIEQNSEKTKEWVIVVTQMYLTPILKYNKSNELAPISDIVLKLDHKW